MKKFVSVMLTLAMLLTAAAALAETPSITIDVAGAFGDRSFYDSANEGASRLEADFGTVVKRIECNENDADLSTSLYDAADATDMIAAIGWQFGDYLSEAAAAYPDKMFLFIDNEIEDTPANMMSVSYAQNEGSFLVGYIAGKLTKTNIVGAVGGEKVSTIDDFLVGYEAGARYANPDVQVKRAYAGTYENPAEGKKSALMLYDSGCDIVFAVAGKTGEGVFEAAAEKNQLAIGVDSDQKYINPDVIICSMVKKVGQSIYDVVANADTMFKGGEVWKADMATGYIDVAYGTDDMPQQVSEELKAEVEALKEKIISGEITVPTAFE